MKTINYKDLILYQDSDYLALNKPPMIPTIPDRTGMGFNLITELRKQFEDIKLCHRLDKDTSGVILFAKNKEAQRHLNLQFSRRQVYKEYHAIVSGKHNFQAETTRGAIHIKGNRAIIDSRKGKKAKTIFNTKKIFNGYTLLNCKPITGRTHQIRIHASSRKASLIGDHKYKGKDIFLSELKRNYKFKNDEKELPIIKRIALHAYEIKFKNINDEEISINAPYANDFNLLLKYLEKYSKII